MTMRTTIKLTWHPDISMGDYSDALNDIAQAIMRNQDSITNVRWGSEPTPPTPVRKQIRKKKEPYRPPAETGGESGEE